ncbi:DUF4838 domain-containing protein [bacterium]|nr:DUF4838 domain-containing protein [bacterium]
MTPQTESITLDLSLPWQVMRHNDAPTAQLALTELQDHWLKISGLPLTQTVDGKADRLIVLRVDGNGDGNSGDNDEDGFTWHAQPNRIEITGHSPRGLLFAVYHVLEALGCRWLAPGPQWTRIPQTHSAQLPNRPIFQSPSLRGRCLILGHYAFIIDAEDWIIWAARNRYNTIFIHTTHEDVGIGAVPEWAWQRYRFQAMKRIRERGMILELGGHGLPALLPRSLFKQMPLAFREEDGKRTPKFNFCPSSPEAKYVVQENARRYFEENPGIDVYHIWADDIPGGGWCRCPMCKHLNSTDQLMLATNMVAEVLAEVHPRAELSFISYLDTEEPARHATPLPNLCLLWAPRTRNYGKATDDPSCPVNTPYYPDTFKTQIEAMKEAGTVRVFEYYSDAVLFKSVLPVLTDVLAQDVRFYRDIGVHTLQTLMTGDHPWVSAQWTNWLFGRLTWDAEADVNVLLADYCEAAFGAAAPSMIGYYNALESAFALVLDQTPDQRGARPQPNSPFDIVRTPMNDMEDPIYAQPDTLRRRAADTSTILAQVDEAAAHVHAAQKTAPSSSLSAEATQFELTRAWLTFTAHRIRLYDAVSSNPPASHAQQHWDAASRAYRQVTFWADRHLQPPFRENVKVIHLLMWQARLRRILADQLTPSWQRLIVDAGTVAQTAQEWWALNRAYKKGKETEEPLPSPPPDG